MEDESNAQASSAATGTGRQPVQVGISSILPGSTEWAAIRVSNVTNSATFMERLRPAVLSPASWE